MDITKINNQNDVIDRHGSIISISRFPAAHYGFRHTLITEYVLNFNTHPILYIDYIRQYNFRRMVKLRDIIRIGNNVYPIIAGDDLNEEYERIKNIFSNTKNKKLSFEIMLESNMLNLIASGYKKLDNKINEFNARFDKVHIT